MKAVLNSFCLLIAIVQIAASSQPSLAHQEIVKAPPLRDCKVSQAKELGIWDDVFAVRDRELIILRKGTQLYSLKLSSAGLKKLISFPTLSKSQIVATGISSQSLWLFLNSGNTTPFAVDVNRGRIVRFSIPGVKFDKVSPYVIQSIVTIPHANAAILMIAGGNRASWPREGNRPIYFWMNLKSGKVDSFPIGWDLDYFSSDQMIAVFEKPSEAAFQRRPSQALSIKDNRLVNVLPDQQQAGILPFHWYDTARVKAIYKRYPKTNAREYFAGLSVRGVPFLFDLNLKEVQYINDIRLTDNFIGFTLRREGDSGLHTPLWVSRLNQPPRPELISSKVKDFAMLSGGNVIFTSANYPYEVATEAFVHTNQQGVRWNVLDDVPLYPPLDQNFAGKNHVLENIHVRLTQNIGLSSNLVLCSFSFSRQDRRDFLALSEPIGEKRLLPLNWNRTIVITSKGERFMTPLFREGSFPEQIWLHNSGKVVTGKYTSQVSDSIVGRKIQVSEIKIQLPKT